MVHPDREPLTMAEARRIGTSAMRHAQLADAVAAAKSGSFTYSTGNGSASIALTLIDLQAALALLIEREAQFLASFNVTVPAVDLPR